MSTQEFIELLKKPETIANYSLDELRELSHKFSYSQPLQLLYAMRLKYSSQHLFDRQLGKASILTNDRKVLFELFEETTQVPAPADQVNLEDYPSEEPQEFEPVASAESAPEPTEAPAPTKQEPSPAAEVEKEVEPAPEETPAPTESEIAEEEQISEEEQMAEEPIVSEEKAEQETSSEQNIEPEAPKASEAQADEAPRANEPEEAAEKSSAKAVMSDRIREILEKNRRMREEALARKEGRPVQSEEEKTESTSDTHEEETAEQTAAQAEQSVEEETGDAIAPEASEEQEAPQPAAGEREPQSAEQEEVESEPEIHSAAAPQPEEQESETQEEDTLEGQSLVDEPQRAEAAQTTNDFVEEELAYERQEAYSAREEPVPSEAEPEPESTLEEEVQQEEYEREPVENTTNDFPEEEPQPTRLEGLSSLEERIAGIRSRLEKLGAEVEKEEPKPESKPALDDEFAEEEAPAEEEEFSFADELDQEYRDIQSRSEHLHEASFGREEPEEELEPEEEEDDFEPISNEEAQQMSFSRWLKQFEQKEEQIEANEEKQAEAEEPAESEFKKASLKFEDKMQLLDSFVEKLPDLKKRKPLISNPPPKMNYEEVQGQAEEEEENSSSLVTETLAKVYIKQKHYKKAIQAYEILRLKYPEKSSLFADRISEIKKLENSK